MLFRSSLLLPKRRPGTRAPLWQQRKRSADLLAVASRYGSFPVLLETYRECLRDFFDMPALVGTLTDLRSRKIRIATVDSDTPSPFAASLLFTYVASFIYDGDAPLAERRAQALAVDQSQLRELLGDAELRELLDADSMDAVERQLQRLDPKFHVKTTDGIHDLLLAIGDLTEADITRRSALTDNQSAVAGLVAARRILPLRIAGEARLVAVEDAARFRDGLGIPLPVGLPESLLQPVRDPLGDLALRYARTHAPFPAADFAARFGVSVPAAEELLIALASDGRLVEGEFRPGGTRREWTDGGVLRMLRRRSLARLRHEVEPVDQAVLGRFATAWQGIVRRRQGADALLDVVEQLQGAPLPASILETEILPARLDRYDPSQLDAVTAAGEVVWVGVESLGERDGRISLYLADHLARLLPPHGLAQVPEADERETKVLEYLSRHGASFFGPLHESIGAGYPAETVDALWNLVWRGLITNDTFHPLRAFTRAHAPKRARRPAVAPAFRSRRLVPRSAEGRWSLVSRRDRTGQGDGSRGSRAVSVKDHTRWAAAVAQQLLARHGVLTRESVAAEGTPGGFGTVYPVLKSLEEGGRIRRGYFVAGLGATQFALPGAVDMLRSLRDGGPAGALEPDPEISVLAATDPANPYGATLKWPASTSSQRSDKASAARAPTRSVGATVILFAGALGAYLARGDRQLTTFLPDAEPDRTKIARAVARVLIDRAHSGDDTPRGMLIEEIDGRPPGEHPIRLALVEAGFVAGALGLQATVRPRPAGEARPSPTARDFAAARRPSRSTISSPFASRYFDADGDDHRDEDQDA